MPNLKIVLEEPAWPELSPDEVVPAERLEVTALERGMVSGKPSVAIRVDAGGDVVIAQTSLALFLTAADVLKAKFGDPRLDDRAGQSRGQYDRSSTAVDAETRQVLSERPDRFTELVKRLEPVMREVLGDSEGMLTIERGETVQVRLKGERDQGLACPIDQARGIDPELLAIQHCLRSLCVARAYEELGVTDEWGARNPAAIAQAVRPLWARVRTALYGTVDSTSEE